MQGPVTSLGQESSEPLEFPMRRPPFWSVNLLSCLFGAVAGSLASLVLLRPMLPDRGIAVFFAALVVAILLSCAIVLVRSVTRSRSVPAIRLGREAALLPARAGSRRVVSVPYSEILSLDVRDAMSRRLVSIGTLKRTFLYPADAFSDPGDIDRLAAGMQQRIRAAVGGDEAWEHLVDRSGRLERLLKRRLVVAPVAVAALLIVFYLEASSGALSNSLKLVELGANSSVLVREGQWFRLLTGNLLHAGVIHLVANAICLLLCGLILERLIGSAKFLLVLIASAAGGSLTSALLGGSVLSVGASPGIFGLFAASAVLGLRHRDQLPGAGFQQARRSWLVFVAINVALPLLVPRIDWAAHLGGAITGATLAASMTWRVSSVDALPKPSRLSRSALAVALAVFVAAIGAGIRHYLRPADEDVIRVARGLASSFTNSFALNSAAWALLKDAGATTGELEAGQILAMAAWRRDPGNPAFLDTLATSHYRLGELGEAIALERQAFRSAPSGIYAAQLSRFMVAAAGSEPILLGDSRASDVRVGVEPATSAVSRALVAHLDRDFPAGATVLALAMREGAPIGLLRIVLAPGHARTHRMRDADDPALSYLEPGLRFRVALVEPSRGGEPKEGEGWWLRWLDRDIAELP